jgi:hypothetical protein
LRRSFASTTSYKKKRAGGSIDQAVDQMRKDLRIRAGGENAIRIEFSYPDPAKAQLAASSVASRFIEGNLVLAGRVIDQSGRRPRMQIRLTDPASSPYIQEAPSQLQEAPSQLAGSRRGLAIGGLLGAAAAWFLGRRRAPASA